MKSVKELHEIAENSHKRPAITTTRMIADALIGITEHLEARAVVVQPFCQAVTVSDNLARSTDWTVTTTMDAARRDGMIAALRWVKDNMHMWTEQELVIRDAIARITNGGDL